MAYVPGNRKQHHLFEALCEAYYERVLRYLYAVLQDESSAKDCAQDVFLVALQKIETLDRHPNPGGFLLQTAKNLSRKARREGFTRMLREGAEDDPDVRADKYGSVEEMLDREIDEALYMEQVLSSLTEEKRKLYNLYYLGSRTMADIARELGVEEAALRMRFVRLRKEIRGIVETVAQEHFPL